MSMTGGSMNMARSTQSRSISCEGVFLPVRGSCWRPVEGPAGLHPALGSGMVSTLLFGYSQWPKIAGWKPDLGEGEFLSCRTGIFDAVLIMNVICFKDDVARSFQEAFRVLRPGDVGLLPSWKKTGRLPSGKKEPKVGFSGMPGFFFQ